MPNEIKDLGDGNLEVTLGTGEKFTGTAMEVTTKLADAHQNTKEWARGKQTEAENLRAEVNRLNTPPPPPITPAAQEEANLQKYLLDQVSRAEGFNNSDERMAALKDMRQAADDAKAQRVVGEFFQRRPDFPNTPEAQEKLWGYIKQNHWDENNPVTLVAAHDSLVRDGAYKALTPEEINRSWSQGLQASNEPAKKAPPMIGTGGTDTGAQSWQERASKMSLDELRTEVLRNGQAQGQTR